MYTFQCIWISSYHHFRRVGICKPHDLKILLPESLESGYRDRREKRRKTGLLLNEHSALMVSVGLVLASVLPFQAERPT